MNDLMNLMHHFDLRNTCHVQVQPSIDIEAVFVQMCHFQVMMSQA